MRSLAEYVLRGRRQAAVIALLFSMLPLFWWVGGSIMALVTLRQGMKEGGIIFLWLILPAVVLAILGHQQIWVFAVFGAYLFTYSLAIVLRNTASWILILQISMLVGIFATVIVHSFFPELITVLHKNWLASLSGSGAEYLLSFALGMQIVVLLLINLISLGLARWWQSIIFNPGGFSLELQNIRTGWLTVAILGAGLIGCLIKVDWMIDSLPVILLPFVVTAFSLMHYLVNRKNMSVWWLVTAYLLLIISFPFFALALSVIGILDYWLDFRQRFVS